MEYKEFLKKRKEIKEEILNSNCDYLCNLCSKEWFCLKDKENKNNCFLPMKELVAEEFCDAI